MAKNTYKVYAHIIPTTVTGFKHDKYYIGITNKKYAKERFGKNGEGYKRQVFWKAIQKYGWDNIEHKILFENLTEKEAKDVEVALIDSLNSKCGVNGYNVTDGGESTSCKFNPVYCVELNMFFKNIKIASDYTGDNSKAIYSACKNNIDTNNLRTRKYRYCKIDNAYKYMDNYGFRITQKTKPLINLNDNKLFVSKRSVDKYYGIKINDSMIYTTEKYLYKLSENKISKYAVMKIEDYLKIYDHT